MMRTYEKSLDASIQQQDLHNKYQSFFGILESKNLTPIFQPIIDLNRRSIHGYESLIRGPSDSLYHSPVNLFDIAIRSGKLVELDLLCREKGIAGFQEKQLPGKLFLNATPESLLEPTHRSGLTLEILEKAGINPKNVVIEITEQHPMDNFDVMRKAMQHYKSMGFEIAMDDLGAGYSGLRRWSELRPDYVKIDRHFVQGIHEDKTKQSFVSSINDIAQGMGCKVIAEGIETKDEYKTVFSIGIEIGQGYYFSRPEIMPPYIISNELFCCSSPHDCGSNGIRTSEDLTTLLFNVPSVTADVTLEDVHMLLNNQDDLTSIPVLDNNDKPLGLIRRSNLQATLSMQYGRALYGSKSVMDFVDKSTVIADKEWNIEQVSKLITDNMQSQIEDDFIITENGQYAGLGKVVQLLKRITDLQIKNARYANPLTLLPGNVPIYEKLDELLSSNSEFCIAYCDIDNFKPFNDVYGYEKGDQIIKMLSDILLQYSDPNLDFVGHVGGDDFIVIFKNSDWHQRCNSILKSFEKVVPNYYSYIDRNNKGIWTKSRSGEDNFFPLMSLSIGAVSPDTSLYTSHGDIAGLSALAKKNAKNIPGNSLFIDRRNLLPL